ncbi:hypothetical protein GCM10022221_68090 [Actinocorallia aurea]
MDDETTQPAPGRPLKLLDDEVRDRILEAISHGAAAVDACEYAGISESTYYAWAARGRAARDELDETGTAPPTERPFLEFLESLTRAHAQGRVHAAGLLRKLMDGGYVVKTRTKRYRDPASGDVVEETEEDIAPPAERSVHFFLERRSPEVFGRGATALEVSGPAGGPLVGGTDMEALAALVSSRARDAEGEGEGETVEPNAQT